MGKFIIGTTDFGIGEVECEIDKTNSIVTNLKIRGSKELYEKITEKEKGEWNWTLYPPKFYVNHAHFAGDGKTIRLHVDEAFLDDNEVALYLMEHNDFFGEIVIDKNVVMIKGKVFISGKEMDLEIETEFK